jgi:myo-inositol 2-dehydrogenase/D-chiro-inositol 1-dehydrogenase/scyllo-inositol 2-dehydrogenase (NAD+)
MRSDTVGVGIIGAGRAGMGHARNFAFGINGARLVAIAEPNATIRATASAELKGVQAYAHYEELLQNKDVHAVFIVTPTAFHRDIAVRAAQAGKHIFCEKPMAMTAPECQDMIAAAKTADVKLQIGFMRRFDRNFVEAKARIERGEIGQVVQVKSLTHGPSTPQPWMYDIKKSNGPLAEVNSHDIDTIRWFTGSDIASVYALGGNYRCPDARAAFPDFYDNVLVLAHFENNMQGMIGGAQGVKYGYDARVEILGTEGILFVGQLEDSSIVSCTSTASRRNRRAR